MTSTGYLGLLLSDLRGELLLYFNYEELLGLREFEIFRNIIDTVRFWCKKAEELGVDAPWFNAAKCESQERYLQLVSHWSEQVYAGSEKYIGVREAMLRSLREKKENLFDVLRTRATTTSDDIEYAMCKSGSIELVKILNLDAKIGNHGFHLARYIDTFEVEWLLVRCRKIREIVETAARYNPSILMHEKLRDPKYKSVIFIGAAAGGTIELVAPFYSQIPDWEVVSRAAYTAALGGQVGSLKLIMKNRCRADLDILLCKCAEGGSVECLDYVCSLGASAYVNALSFAISAQKLDAVKWCLSKGIALETAFIRAARAGSLPMLEYFYSRGARNMSQALAVAESYKYLSEGQRKKVVGYLKSLE